MKIENLRFVSLTNEVEGEFKGVAGEFIIPATDELSAMSPADPAFFEAVARRLLTLLQEHISSTILPE